MSTKATIKHGHNFHLYEEVFDDERIYLQIETDDYYISRKHNLMSVLTIAIDRKIAYDLGLLLPIEGNE